MITLLRFFLYAALICGPAISAHAQEISDEIQTVSIKSAKKIENISLEGDDLPLDLDIRDIWENSSRQNVTNLIKALPSQYRSAFLSRLIISLLIQPVNVKEEESTENIKAGQDLLTIRLQKLNEMGAYHHALRLYRALEDLPYDTALAAAGIEAMLFSGHKGSACLEANSLAETFEGDEYFNMLSSYCAFSVGNQSIESVSLTPALTQYLNNPSNKFGIKPEEFEKLSSLEKAILAAENKINFAPHHDDYKTLPKSLLPVFLQNKDLDTNVRLSVLSDTAARGQTQPSLIIEIMREEIAKNKNSLEKEPFLSAYNDLLGQPDSKNFIAALSASSNSDIALFMPFADFILKISADELEEDTIYKLLELSHITGQNPPKSYIDQLIEKEQNNLTEYILSLSYNNPLEANYKLDYYKNNIGHQTLALYIKEALNDKKFDIDNPFDRTNHDSEKRIHTYGNEYYLTNANDYVMPNPVVWDRYLDVSQYKATGEAIALSAVLLNHQPATSVYPVLLRDILTGLRANKADVLAKQISREIALEYKTR